MTFVYKMNGKEITLEEMVKEHNELWDNCMKRNYLTFKGSCLLDIIGETSDEFEECLSDENKVIFIKNDDKGFDLNLLLNGVVTY